MKPTSDELWQIMRTLEGTEFETKTGKTFTFGIDGNVLRTSRTDQNLSKANFERALELWPFEPGEVSRQIRGSAYVWGILHDRRVRTSDW
jgi:hypothetical protein